MAEISQVKMWIYIGILLIILAVLMIVAGIVIFHYREKKLKHRLEQEYGTYKKYA